MAINPESQYPGKINPSSGDYPYGSAKNVTVAGDGTGTPWEAALVNDLFGWQQAILAEAGVVPSGTPEKATDSQYLIALNFSKGKVVQSYAAAKALDVSKLLAGTKVFINDGARVGEFVWDDSDLSTEVTADTQEGVFVPPTSDPSGASGAFRRILTAFLTPEMFGASGDLTGDDAAALNGATSLAEFLGIGYVRACLTYRILSAVSVPNRVIVDLCGLGIVEQATDGVNIFDFTGAVSSKSRMQVINGRLRYTNQQSTVAGSGVLVADGTTTTSRWLLFNLSIEKAYHGVYCPDGSNTFLCACVDVTTLSSEAEGYYFGGGASVHTNVFLRNLWAQQVPGSERPNSRGYRLQNIQEINAQNLAVDNAQSVPFIAQACKGVISNIAVESCDRSASSGTAFHVGFADCQITVGTVLVTANNVTLTGSANFGVVYTDSDSVVTVDTITDNDTNLSDSSSGNYRTIFTDGNNDRVYNKVVLATGTSPAVSTSDTSDNRPKKVREINGVTQLLELDGVYVGTKASIPTTTDFPEQSIVLNSNRTVGGVLGWQLIGGVWVDVGGTATVTSAELDDISSDINTLGKFDGKQVYNTATNLPLWASAGGASGVWRDASGVTQHTPS